MTSTLAATPTAAWELTAISGCSKANLIADGCGVDNTGTSVNVTGTKTTTSDDDRSDNDNNRSDDDGTDTGTWTPPRTRTVDDFADCIASWDAYRRCFRDIGDEDEDPTTPEPPPLPEVTLADIAQFAPPAAVLGAEPGNAGIADMPTNFTAAASVHTQSGTLFGYPISVRFTPVGYDYVFGDGTGATFTTAGRSWQDLGQATFTPTPTSHVYADRGTYTATLSIRYSAEIDLGSGWFPIAGQLTITSADQAIRIFEAHTALVDHTCTEAPGAPGC